MKFIKSYIVVLVLGAMMFTSCEDYFGDINVDPDNPTSVTPNVLLPQIEVRMAYVVGGDASRYTSLYTQHAFGCCRQFFVYNQYGVLGADTDALWGQNLYSSIMNDNRQLMAQAQESGYNHYLAISKAMEAYALMLTTDLFGDCPYTSAFQGTEVLEPTFDTQESVYNSIFSLLDESRNAMALDDGGFAPGADDLIYAGDMTKWAKFVNVLEARGRLHIGNVDAANYQRALDALLRGGYDSAADEARVQFGAGATEAAPWAQYIEQRDDIDLNPTYLTMLQNLNDPREATYGFELTQGVAHPILTRDRAFPLLSFTEQEFIKAEATMKTTGSAAAHPIYLGAIEASFADAKVSADYATYVAQPEIDPGTANLTMTEIMTQKYLALFMDPEVFTDWRRTGIPALSPNAGTQIPVRLPYGQNEVLSNTNTPSPSDVTQFTPVWWDR